MWYFLLNVESQEKVLTLKRFAERHPGVSPDDQIEDSGPHGTHHSDGGIYECRHWINYHAASMSIVGDSRSTSFITWFY